MMVLPIKTLVDAFAELVVYAAVMVADVVATVVLDVYVVVAHLLLEISSGYVES